MKASEAPEKLYIFNPEKREVWFSKTSDKQVEYIRTDAFIEKATLWLLTNANDYCILHNSYDTKGLVKDFVDAMKRD